MFFNVAGIDPGVVHTGIVTLKFDFMGKELTEKHAVVDGIDPIATAAKLSSMVYPATLGTCDTFIEKYRPRSGFSTNDKLMEANATLPPETLGELLQNTGVVKVVSKELMEYDPRLAKLCEEVFGDTELVYTKPATRLDGHLAGYDPSKAPTF